MTSPNRPLFERILLALVNIGLRATMRPLWARGLSAQRMRRAFAIGDWFFTIGRRLPALRIEDIGSCKVEWIGAHEQAAPGVLVFVHGGSFVVRGARSDRLLGADLARRTGLAVAVPDYRLAPEHPFPAPLEDCEALYCNLLARGIGAGQIVFVGHSAGANLISATLMRLRAAGLPQPAGAVLLSGCLDLTGPTPAALAIEGKDVGASVHIWPWTTDLYLPGMDLRHPHASPLFGDWHGLAPLQFQVSDSELPYDTVLAAAERARAAGVEVSLRVWPGMPHVYPALDMFAEGRQCREEIASFALRVIGTVRDSDSHAAFGTRGRA